jgi:GntP family gluconate:H+ symporter
MMPSFSQSVIFLCTGIAVIILLTAKFRVHAFFALMIACFVTGFGVQMHAADILIAMKEGFGNIMRSLGFIIVLGTTLGVLLEHTGSTKVMAAFILKKTGERNAALAMSITGFIVGLPIFCDSGFIVLSGLNKSLAKKTGIPIAVTSVSLATGLYAVHCLIPPHPGAAAAAGVINVDVGKLMLIGIAAALPAMLVGHWWAKHAGKNIITNIEEELLPEAKAHLPSTAQSFLPVAVPVILIAIKSFLSVENISNDLIKIFATLGDPVIALSVGVLLALTNIKHWKKDVIGKLLTEGVEKAGSILVIIGAGGAFGAVLAATKLGEHFSQSSSLSSFGIFFPFLVTFVLKTAQGSSTVAIITAASIIQPLLPALHLESDWGKLLCVLSMGAGSMMISHVNDAFFWVITKFSGMDMRTVLKVYSLATLFMGLITIAVVYLLSLLLL